MEKLCHVFIFLLISLFLGTGISFADNQTTDLSPIYPEAELPFTIRVELANFQLPQGIQSGAVGEYKGEWVFIAGRINGQHGFNSSGDNFPIVGQNTSIYVVNPSLGTVTSRSLSDTSSGLTQKQIDSLSVTAPEWYQSGTTLYLAGGYGIDTGTATFDTKDTFTAINLPGIIQWVTNPHYDNYSVIQNISQLHDPIFQITGGQMRQLGNEILLIFGQNFTGEYTDTSNGVYSEQVHRFQIKNINGQMSAVIKSSIPVTPDPNFRRRDLNVIPILLSGNSRVLEYGFAVLAGVFTETSGVWNVPVVIRETGEPVMADPNLATTFKQGMNQYACATANLYSKKYKSSYHILLGGMSYGYFSGGVFQTDAEIPYINQITTVKMDQSGHFTQYLMNNEYPVIIQTQPPNPGNLLNFGSGAYFIANNILKYPNNLISLDTIRKETVIGYIVGGIQSTVPNTTDTLLETSASPYVFKVILTPR